MCTGPEQEEMRRIRIETTTIEIATNDVAKGQEMLQIKSAQHDELSEQLKNLEAECEMKGWLRKQMPVVNGKANGAVCMNRVWAEIDNGEFSLYECQSDAALLELFEEMDLEDEQHAKMNKDELELILSSLGKDDSAACAKQILEEYGDLRLLVSYDAFQHWWHASQGSTALTKKQNGARFTRLRLLRRRRKRKAADAEEQEPASEQIISVAQLNGCGISKNPSMSKKLSDLDRKGSSFGIRRAILSSLAVLCYIPSTGCIQG